MPPLALWQPFIAGATVPFTPQEEEGELEEGTHPHNLKSGIMIHILGNLYLYF